MDFVTMNVLECTLLNEYNYMFALIPTKIVMPGNVLSRYRENVEYDCL